MQISKKHILVNLAVAALLSSACNKPQPVAKTEKFIVSDTLLKRLLLDTVKQANGKTELTLSATISANEERKTEIYPIVSGTVNKVNARLGDYVRKNQVLATITSSEMAAFDKDAIAAKAELKTAERKLQQTENLFKTGLSSEKELEEARNDYQIKQAELKRANSVLKLNGGNTAGLYTLKSPLNGFVIDKSISDYMQLREDHDQSLFTIADLSDVWAMISVYESDISQLKTGDEVSLSTLAYPDKVFKGKIDKIYNLIDPDTKVMKARVVISNPDFLLKPGMLGTVRVQANSGIDLPVVRAESVIFDHNKNYVLVLDQNRKINIREISIARKAANKIYVARGLEPGEHLIASRQVFLFENLKAE